MPSTELHLLSLHDALPIFINYAVPVGELDITVSDLVERLLKRPAYPLAWAKRVVNRQVVDQLNRTLDAGAGYEMIGLAQLERQDRKSTRLNSSHLGISYAVYRASPPFPTRRSSDLH